MKITKVRLWRVSEGRPRAQTVSDSPVVAPDFSYLNNMSWLRTYTHEGAAQIRVCFDGFQVEPYYDYVEIRDASERIVQVLTGDLGESASFCSAWVEGATVKVRFFTDASVVSRGFRVYRLESKRAHPVEARFPGQWLERETIVKDATTQTTVYAGLHNNWHRFYDPETARYITPDPLGLMAGMNPFAYVEGDPVNGVDFDGRMPVWLVPLGWRLAGALLAWGSRAGVRFLSQQIPRAFAMSAIGQGGKLLQPRKCMVNGALDSLAFSWPQKLGGLFPEYVNHTVRDAIKARGGGSLSFSEIDTDMLDKTLEEVAKIASDKKHPDSKKAETAIKLVKQASKKKQKYGGKDGSTKR